MAKIRYCSYQTELEIPFFDVDGMQIVWHGNYVKYLEVARCAFLRAMGYDYRTMGENGFSWPVVQLHVKYIKPAIFGQKITVKIDLTEYESCLKLDYLISDAKTGARLSKASTMQVAVSLESGEMQLQTPESWQKAVCHYIAVQQISKTDNKAISGSLNNTEHSS